MPVHNPAVGAILNEIHGLLHEARSNVEIDLERGKTLLQQVAGAAAAHQQGALEADDLARLLAELGQSIQPSIEKELSIDNPEAAVIQIRGLLDRLQTLS